MKTWLDEQLENMTSEQRKLLRAFLIMELCGLIGAWYIAVMFRIMTTVVIGSGQETSYGLFAVLRNTIEYGIPWTEMFLIFLLLTFAFTLYFIGAWKRQKGMDVLGRNFRHSQSTANYGDAHFATPKEVEDMVLLQTPKEAMGPILGSYDKAGKRVFDAKLDAPWQNMHMMIIGRSGTGKTSTVGKPYLLQCAKRRESVIITDPKGELYRDCSAFFKKRGYVVRKLDWKYPLKSDGWDCMKVILNGEDKSLRAQLFAETVISNSVNPDEMGQVYATGAMQLLKALLLRVALDDQGYPREKKSINTVFQELQNPRGVDHLEALFDPLNMPKSALESIGPYMAVKRASANLLGNIITNLSSYLQLLQNNVIQKILSTDEIDLTRPAKQPCAYFCVFPDTHATYKFLNSLFFSFLFIELTDYADQQPDGRCPIPVNVLMDELPSLGTIPNLSTLVATTRSRAISITMIVQDLTQLQNAYKASWETLLNNCSYWMDIGINDRTTAQYLCERIGETTIEVETNQRQFNRFTQVDPVAMRKSTGDGKRSLLSVSEVIQLPPEYVITICANHRPLLAYKYPFYLHPDAKDMNEKVLPNDIPSIMDDDARRARFEEDEAYIADYLRKNPLQNVERNYRKYYENIPTESDRITFGEAVQEMILSIKDKVLSLFGRRTLPAEQDVEDSFEETEGEEIWDISDLEMEDFRIPGGTVRAEKEPVSKPEPANLGQKKYDFSALDDMLYENSEPPKQNLLDELDGDEKYERGDSEKENSKAINENTDKPIRKLMRREKE